VIFVAKFRNLSTTEMIGNMENACAVALVPLSPSSVLALSLGQRIIKQAQHRDGNFFTVF